jgi:hypothetical protein
VAAYAREEPLCGRDTPVVCATAKRSGWLSAGSLWTSFLWAQGPPWCGDREAAGDHRRPSGGRWRPLTPLAVHACIVVGKNCRNAVLPSNGKNAARRRSINLDGNSPV